MAGDGRAGGAAATRGGGAWVAQPRRDEAAAARPYRSASLSNPTDSA